MPTKPVVYIEEYKNVKKKKVREKRKRPKEEAKKREKEERRRFVEKRGVWEGEGIKRAEPKRPREKEETD